MFTRQLAGKPGNSLGEFDWTSRGPVFLPDSFGRVEITSIEVVVSRSGGKGRADLGIRKPARYGGVAPVPQLSRQFAPLLFNEELYERTRIEINQGHESATLLAHQIGHIRAGPWSATTRRLRSFRPFGPGDDTLNGEAFEGVGGVHSKQSGDRDTTVGDDDLVPVPGLLEPFAQMCSQFTHSDVHERSVQDNYPTDVRNQEVNLEWGSVPNDQSALVGG